MRTSCSPAAWSRAHGCTVCRGHTGNAGLWSEAYASEHKHRRQSCLAASHLDRTLWRGVRSNVTFDSDSIIEPSTKWAWAGLGCYHYFALSPGIVARNCDHAIHTQSLLEVSKGQDEFALTSSERGGALVSRLDCPSRQDYDDRYPSRVQSDSAMTLAASVVTRRPLEQTPAGRSPPSLLLRGRTVVSSSSSRQPGGAISDAA